MKNLYVLDDGETHWIVATSEEEAVAIGKKEYCIGGDPVTVGLVLSDTFISIHLNHDSQRPDKHTIVDGACNASAAQWCEISEVGDLIGSTLY